MGAWPDWWPATPVGTWWDTTFGKDTWWGKYGMWVVYLIIILVVMVAVAYVWRSFR